MIWNWGSAFEAVPSGSDFGSVSGIALRTVKDAFLTLLSVEHEVDMGVDAVVSHSLGLSSVLGPAVQGETTIVEGGVLLDTGALYSNDGLETLGFGDHSFMVNVAPSDHPQYFSRTTPEIKGPVGTTKVVTLPTVLQEYVGTHFLLSNAGHPEDSTPEHGTVPDGAVAVGSSVLTLTQQSATYTFYSDATTGVVVAEDKNIASDTIIVTPLQTMPTPGSYVLSLGVVEYDATRRENLAAGNSTMFLVAPPGTGGSDYQTNLALAQYVGQVGNEGDEVWEDKVTFSCIGIS